MEEEDERGDRRVEDLEEDHLEQHVELEARAVVVALHAHGELRQAVLAGLRPLPRLNNCTGWGQRSGALLCRRQGRDPMLCDGHSIIQSCYFI